MIESALFLNERHDIVAGVNQGIHLKTTLIGILMLVSAPVPIDALTALYITLRAVVRAAAEPAFPE